MLGLRCLVKNSYRHSHKSTSLEASRGYVGELIQTRKSPFNGLRYRSSRLMFPFHNQISICFMVLSCTTGPAPVQSSILHTSRLVITMRSMYGFATLLLMAIAVSGANAETGKRQWFVRASWERRLLDILGIDCEYRWKMWSLSFCRLSLRSTISMQSFMHVLSVSCVVQLSVTSFPGRRATSPHPELLNGRLMRR